MRKVLKYQFPIEDSFELQLPLNATILKADIQGSVPVLWADVDEDYGNAPIKFILRGTGHEMNVPDGYDAYHVSTFSHGPLVWHLFYLQDIPF